MISYMKKNAIVILISLLVIFIIGLCFYFKKQFSTNDEIPVITMQNIDHSIKNKNGEMLALIYYDKPFFSGESEAISKINGFFETDYKKWLNGEQNNLNVLGDTSIKFFLESLNDMREMYGDEVIIKSPLKYYVDTEVAFLSKDIVSIKQDIHWYSGGPSDTYSFGSTFDLKTGKLIPFTYFYNVNSNDFIDSLTNFLIQSKTVDYLSEHEIKNLYIFDERENFNYNNDSYDHNLNLAYQYYYDRTSICLTLNKIGIHSGYLVKWNGRINDEFEATIWLYNKKNDIYSEFQIYPTKDIET